MNHPCLYPNCTQSFPSERKLNTHYALSHECDSSLQSIPEQAIKSLEICKDRIHYLLKKIPATRSSDQLLYLNYIRVWGGALVYNADTKLVEFRNKAGLTIDEYIHQPNYETCRRSRQALQAKYPELKASELVQAERQLKELGYHRSFAQDVIARRAND